MGTSNDLSIYFSPVNIEGNWSEDQIGSKIYLYKSDFPELSRKGYALIYVPEFRGDTGVHFDSLLPDDFRKEFYALNCGIVWQHNFYDLGTILPGNELKDTLHAIKTVVQELNRLKIIPIIVGGSQDLTLAMYDAYSNLEQLVNICTIDSALDLGTPDQEVSSNAYLSKILVQRPCHLFNLANIGLQIPYAGAKEFDLFEKLYFDICRLGEFNADFKKAEPHLRNADLISLDFTSIKASELLFKGGSPNGFYAEQICQIARYAGMSDKVSSFGIFNYCNITEVSNKLLAQIIWYFIDGIENRTGDFPMGSKKDYVKFTVFIEESGHEIAFYKSNKSARWWMEVPYPAKEGSKYERHHMAPCDKEDYDNAMNNVIPDLWWKTFQKLV
ncbi:MAG: formimidoylglutamase [Bacteroidetes bacterium]|nr:formimidoylglutamase [Bacteroidota bacterium]